jgi:cytochrome c peroxidase
MPPITTDTEGTLMMSRARFGAPVAALLLLAAAGCDRPERADSFLDPGAAPGDVTSEQTGSLDAQLEELLDSVAPAGLDRAYFRLPSPYDLASIPQDPNNPLTDAKVRLGRRLFHETALGTDVERPEGMETYSCAACHHAQGGFQANLPQGIAEGGAGFGVRGGGRHFLPQYDGVFNNMPDIQPIRAPSVMNGAFQQVNLWNGQFGGVGVNIGTEYAWIEGTPTGSNWLGFEGLETQAHAGLKVHRQENIQNTFCAQSPVYQEAFAEAFPGDPNPINRLNAALAIAAYERTLLSNRAPFQEWLGGNRRVMTAAEKRGALVFFGKGGCVACHTGPALNAMEFHALGMGDLDMSYDVGRVNLKPFFDTIPWTTRLGRGGFTGNPADYWRFKVPQLYNLADSPFYGHGATFASIREVLDYKNAAVPENPWVPGSDLSPLFVPLGLTEQELTDLTAFLETGLYDAYLHRYLPKNLPSGNCFPVNDPEARIDLGCDEPQTPSQAVAMK